MNENLRTQKDNLAKLMATENLTIVHRKVPTAYFDIKNRVLCCPILKDDLSPYLYDLFMGHEVGHALHTPLEGLHSTIKENRTLKGYLNVIEDVRIERKIRDKFSGLRKSFFKAYNELMDIDFFGIKKRNIQELSLIDKINLITKVGSRVNIKLTDEEQVFLDKALAVDTWEDVVSVAQEIYEWSKENETRDENDESIKTLMDNLEIEEDEELDSFEEDYSETDGTDSDEDYEDDEDVEDYFNDPDDTLPDLDEELKETGSTQNDRSGGRYDDEDGARESLTEHNAHNNEDMFQSEDNHIRVQKDLREFFNSDFMKNNEFVVSYKTLLKDLDEWFAEKENRTYNYSYNMKDIQRLALVTAKKLENRNKKLVMHMAKEFEMRQTALRSAKALTGKTGQLNMNKLAKYQIVDDVFKRVTYLPDGKNHGVNVLVDWSGSISREVCDLLEQAIILTMFCRKTNIPHRVYLFSDQYLKGFDDWGRGSECLVELFSDKQSNKDFYSVLKLVSHIWNNFRFDNASWRGIDKFLDQWKTWYNEDFKGYEDDRWLQIPFNYTLPNRLSLGGTPLNGALIYMRKLLTEFNKNYSIEKSILTVITDGESHQTPILKNTDEETKQINEQIDPNDEYSYRTREKSELIDPYNRRVYLVSSNGFYNFDRTQNLLEWISDSCNTINTGYFIISKKHEALDILEKSGVPGNYRIHEDDWADIRKFGKVYSVKGYNKLFITTSNNLSVQDNDELDNDLIDATKAKIRGAFLKNQRGKVSSRFLTNEFIKEIA